MRKQILTTLSIIGVALALNTAPAQTKAKSSVNQLRELETQVNQATQGSNQWHTAMHTISVQTGVPQDQVRALKQNHPNAQPAGILVACVLADETKKPAEQFLKQHLAGQNWPDIARNNNVPLEKLTVRLQTIRQALTGGAAAKP
jgi:hypothetical protein